MPKYRKKPIVITAEQWDGDMLHLPEGVELRSASCPDEELIPDYCYTDLTPMIRTLEGWLRVSPGDYIITGIQGERYPCKPDIFEATYDIIVIPPRNPKFKVHAPGKKYGPYQDAACGTFWEVGDGVYSNISDDPEEVTCGLCLRYPHKWTKEK